MLHNTTLRFAYMDFFQHYLGYLVFGESVFINRFISDIWLFWLYGSLGRTKHVAHISGTQCILNRDIFGSGSVTNSFYSWSYPVGVWQQGGPTWNLSAGLLKCFYSVKFQEGFQRMNRPSIPDCKKGQKCKSNFPDRVSYSNHFGTKFRSDSWRNVQGTGGAWFELHLGGLVTLNFGITTVRESESPPNLTSISFSPSLPRNWMQQRKNAIDDDGEVVKLDRKMAVTLNWMALWRPDLVLLIEGFDFPFKKVVVISELGKIT